MLSEPEPPWRRPEVRRYAKRLRSFLPPLLTMRSREPAFCQSASKIDPHCLTQNVTGQLPADDWGGVAESGRCRRWREGSAWARGARWCRR
jgi:hypothetical protein